MPLLQPTQGGSIDAFELPPANRLAWYRFETERGEATLEEVFNGRPTSQSPSARAAAGAARGLPLVLAVEWQQAHGTGRVLDQVERAVESRRVFESINRGAVASDD